MKKMIFLSLLASFAFSAHASLQVTKISPETGLTLFAFTRATQAYVTNFGGVMVTAQNNNDCIISKSVFTNTGISPRVMAQELNNLAAARENFRLECYVGKDGLANQIVITDQNGLNGTLFK